MKPARAPKLIFAALLCALAALVFGAAPAIATSTQDVMLETLVVGVPTDRCPMFYVDADSGEIIGIGVDLMRSAAEEAGYSATFEAVKEETLKQALDNDAYDVVMPFGSSIPSASGHATIVSDNLFQTPFTLVTAGSRSMVSLNDLHVGMLSSLGGGAETVRTLYPGIQITLYETMPECVRALRAGEVDALLHNSYVWSYVLQKPSYGDLTVQPTIMFSMDFRAGTLDTPRGQATIARLNDGIQTLTDTRRQAVILDYTSRRLYRNDVFDFLYEYGLFILMATLLTIAVIVIVVQRQRALRKEQDEEMRWLIDHDPLTGVLSLKGFRKRVEELLRLHPDTPYLISYNNINDFKFVNDSYGMEAGDELLHFWASKSMEFLSDEEAICRIAGDHFAVLRRAGGDEQILWDEQHVLNPVRNFFIDRGKDKRVQLCSGIYVLEPDDYRHVNVDRMLDYARVAQKRAQEHRVDGFEFYNPAQWEREQRTADIVASLPAALLSHKVQVWYQPQVDYRTGEVFGVEALSRWNHDKLGWLKPTEFITTLEEAGAIYELDRYVWERACADLSRWNAEGHRQSVSVNLSRCDITDGRDIPAYLHNLVRTYGIEPSQLCIEITETAFSEDPELLIRTALQLQALGFHVEMDDFGSGSSSLNMLKEVLVDRIKLDLRFLTNTGDAQRSHTIVSHIIQMVQELGMGIIAEGVETEEQASFLHDQGCDTMQGFYFYKPMPADELERTVLNA